MSAMESVKEVLLASGAGWVLWFLGALSMSSLALAMERWLYLRKRAGNLEALARLLDEQLRAGDFARARQLLEASPAVAARVADAGLRLADRGSEAAEKAMDSAAALERGRLERGLAFLATIGNNAPFIGLFGTVLGIIRAFHDLAGNSLQGTQAVMSGIAEALVATGVGLLVALPAVAAYNIFTRQVERAASASEVLAHEILALLKAEPARAGGVVAEKV
jgi:biopolymer transport protein ExbB